MPRLAPVITATRSISVASASSLGPGDESWHAGFHHRVESDVRGDTVPNVAHSICGKSRNLIVLLNAFRFGRGGQESTAALRRPGENNLSGRDVHALSDSRNHRVF